MEVDLRDFYDDHETERAKRQLEKKNVTVTKDIWKTRVPLKYLGIELQNGKYETRFALADAVMLTISPRSKDGDTSGLKMSKHRKAFMKEMKDVDDMLSIKILFVTALKANLGDFEDFKNSDYAKLCSEPLRVLERRIGIPVHVSLQVLRTSLPFTNSKVIRASAKIIPVSTGVS